MKKLFYSMPSFTGSILTVVLGLVIAATFSSATVSAGGPAEDVIRLAYGRKIHYAPQIIALKESYFENEGVRVKGLVLMAGIQCAEALSTGSADVGVMGDAPAIFAVASGRPVKIVASYGGGEKMHRIVVSKDSGIRSPADLEGKRVAVQRGSSTHGAFLLFCQKNKVDPAGLRLMYLRPVDMPEAMLSGQIDAAVGSEPWPSNIEVRVPGSRELATLSGLGNEFPLMMLVTTRLARERPEAVTALMRATARAIALIKEKPERAAEIIAGVTGVPVRRELKVMQSLSWGLRLDEAVRSSLEQTSAFLVKEGKISKKPDLKAAFDYRFIER